MRTLIKVGASLLLLAFALIAVSYSMLRTQGVSSPNSAAGRALRSEVRQVSADITVIDLNGPINLTLRKGATASLKVRGEQRLLGNIDTSEDGNTLHIGPKGMLLHHRQPLSVELVLPWLAQLEVHGNGDSSVNGFSGDSFVLKVHGSGNVTFNGRFKEIVASVYGSGDVNLNGGNSDSVELEMVGSGQITASGGSKEVKATLTGSGDIDAEHLSADKVEVLLQGSGTTSVYARKEAELTLRGSGDIKVRGNPERRSSNRTGSGEISWD
ncbi:GIN domain-containing protein [Janthinobacterium agaricidamnosum]|uniref:Putative auto-transporter adhesin head GIN domain-containing protein n=1 Tax=Janthinobacterium agaricidamnosum NBRC 102515 = DSM 9628 TaxID=1349767 RepID=W0V6Y1_9BURK|nr:DUF2807 domain-containing protein [Janthinobacterium agaricidamnosum]CDG83012.1 hypothetical protein GJA_2378 [Janthinobacterium agaricidamnosum NBRC 102515 = DSM 9628]